MAEVDVMGPWSRFGESLTNTGKSLMEATEFTTNLRFKRSEEERRKKEELRSEEEARQHKVTFDEQERQWGRLKNNEVALDARKEKAIQMLAEKFSKYKDPEAQKILRNVITPKTDTQFSEWLNRINKNSQIESTWKAKLQKYDPSFQLDSFNLEGETDPEMLNTELGEKFATTINKKFWPWIKKYASDHKKKIKARTLDSKQIMLDFALDANLPIADGEIDPFVREYVKKEVENIAPKLDELAAFSRQEAAGKQYGATDTGAAVSDVLAAARDLKKFASTAPTKAKLDPLYDAWIYENKIAPLGASGELTRANEGAVFVYFKKKNAEIKKKMAFSLLNKLFGDTIDDEILKSYGFPLMFDEYKAFSKNPSFTSDISAYLEEADKIPEEVLNGGSSVLQNSTNKSVSDTSGIWKRFD